MQQSLKLPLTQKDNPSSFPHNRTHYHFPEDYFCDSQHRFRDREVLLIGNLTTIFLLQFSYGYKYP